MNNNNLKQYELNSNNCTTQWLTLNSLSTPSWGSIVNFDINCLGKIQEAYVVFNLSAISGCTQSSPSPAFSTAFKFFTNITYSYQGQIIDTVTSDVNFINSQIKYEDSDRTFINVSSGNYASSSSRYTLGLSTNSYIVQLNSFINQVQPEILNQNGYIRASMQLDTLNNIVDYTSGSPVCTINSINLLVKLVKFDTNIMNYKLNQLSRGRYQALFCSNLYQTYNILSGSISSSVTLSNFINANINYIYFILRPITGLTKSAGNNYLNYISAFNILNSSNESICGGIIPASQALYVLNRDTTKGSYTSETNSSVFFWHHTKNAILTLSSGLPDARMYTGNETLNLFFTTALTSSIQVDVFASSVAIFNQTTSGCQKL